MFLVLRARKKWFNGTNPRTVLAPSRDSRVCQGLCGVIGLTLGNDPIVLMRVAATAAAQGARHNFGIQEPVGTDVSVACSLKRLRHFRILIAIGFRQVLVE